MTGDLLLVDTARHQYVIRRADVLSIQTVTDADRSATFDPPRIYVELGPLLDAFDHSTLVRRRALLVPLRRRLIALLVDRVELVEGATTVVALPAIIGARLRQPWAIGALMIASELVIQLDLRAVARSAWANVQATG